MDPYFVVFHFLYANTIFHSEKCHDFSAAIWLVASFVFSWLTWPLKLSCDTQGSQFTMMQNLTIKQTYLVSEVWWWFCIIVKHILSVIHFRICGAVCFQFTHSLCDDWENIYTLSYSHHQIRSMNYYPLFRVRSWNNGMRCMSFYILMGIWYGGVTSLPRRPLLWKPACQIYCHVSFWVTQSVSPTVPENPSGPLVDYFLVLPCAACGSQLCGLLPGLDHWSSLHDPRVIWPYHHELWGWPLHYADFVWFLGGLKPKKSCCGPSFLVTQMVKRLC